MLPAQPLVIDGETITPDMVASVEWFLREPRNFKCEPGFVTFEMDDTDDENKIILHLKDGRILSTTINNALNT